MSINLELLLLSIQNRFVKILAQIHFYIFTAQVDIIHGVLVAVVINKLNFLRLNGYMFHIHHSHTPV